MVSDEAWDEHYDSLFGHHKGKKGGRILDIPEDREEWWRKKP